MRVKKSYLLEAMDCELPSKTDQKRLIYRPSIEETFYAYRCLNHYVFYNSLNIPVVTLNPRMRDMWGQCIGDFNKNPKTKSYCTIRLMDKFYCKQWFIIVLAHEMCHQYQWDVIGDIRRKEGINPIMSHGPSFFYFKNELEEIGIPLKTGISIRKWFTTQDLQKC